MQSGAILPWATSSFHNWINVPLTSSKHTETASKTATVSTQSPSPTLRLSNNLLEEDKTCRKINYIPNREKQIQHTLELLLPAPACICFNQSLKASPQKLFSSFRKYILKTSINKAYVALSSPPFHNPTTLYIGLNPSSQSPSPFSFKPHTHHTCHAASCHHFHGGDNPSNGQAC